jgi:hypothetical protein
MSHLNFIRAAGFTGIVTALLGMGAGVSTAHAGNAAKHKASAGQAGVAQCRGQQRCGIRHP